MLGEAEEVVLVKVVIKVLSGLGLRIYANLGQDGTQVCEDPNASLLFSSSTVASLASSQCPRCFLKDGREEAGEATHTRER